jgi:geranylgeranyl pyrophosphate synthase
VSTGERFLEASRAAVHRALDVALPAADEPPALLHEALRYAVLGGGKCLRPALAFAAACACGVPQERVESIAVAVELVHAYSLVHDDLPAMDDDSERRGRPTVHVAFGEDIAILAGDALLALAFAVLCRAGVPPAVIAQLAEAAGSRQLVGGQVDDLRAVPESLTAAQLDSIHARKTGALFRFAVCGAAEAAGAKPDTLERLGRFAAGFGAAFQIADDLADAERSETSVLQVMPAEQARRVGLEHAAGAQRALAPLGPEADALAGLLELVSQRLGTL